MADEADDTLPDLYHACMADDLPRVKRLLEAGATPNDGESIYHAAQENRRDCLELLLAHGADLSGRDPTHDNTPLFFLCGHRPSDEQAPTALAGMTWLVEHGADPNVSSYDAKEMPLHAAARNGWRDAVELLLSYGAAVDPARADGRTPFVLAVRNGHAELAELLRTRGAAASGPTPLDEFLGACIRGDEASARALIAASPGLIAGLDAEGRGAVAQAVSDRREAGVRLLAELGFDLGWESTWAGTPLHHAAWLGEAGLVRLLLSLGAPLDARDSRFGSSPIGWAAHGSSSCQAPDADHVEVVRLLLDAGADRAASINRWDEPPEGMASPAVVTLLRARGFAP